MKEDENKISEIVQYLDSLVTIMNPGQDMPISERHSC